MVMLGVAVICSEPVSLFELGVVADVFARPHGVPDAPRFDAQWCAQTPGHLFRAPLGARMGTPFPLAAAENAKLVIYVGNGEQTTVTSVVRSCLEDANARAAHVLLINVTPSHVGLAPASTLVSHTGSPMTLVDTCLRVCQSLAGAPVAAAIAQRLGTTYECTPEAVSESSLPGLARWLEHNLSRAHTVESLAARCNMSTRTFARRFIEEFGTSPGDWLITQRIAYAKTLLLSTGASVDDIARAVGFNSGTLLRHHFAARVGQSPSAFRRDRCDV